LISAADSKTATPEAIPAGAILCLSLGAFGSGVSLRVNDALLPRLAEQFAVPLSTAAQVISYFAIAYGVSQLLFGPLGDRFGKYRVIAWACAACAITALLCGLAPDFPLLTLARALAGATAAAIIPLAMAWIGDVVPYEKRQPVLARFLIGQILGLSAGVWLGGFAADHLNWRLPYFAIGALFAAVSVALFMINRRLPAHARQTQPASGSALRRITGDFGHVLARPWARKVLATVFLEGAFLYGPFAFFASHLHQDFGVSLSLAGSLVMLFGFGGVLYAVSSAQFVARLGEVGLVRGGGVILSAALLGVALAPAWWWAIPSCLLAGLGFYMLHNTLQINATQMAPERRDAAVSAFASCFFLGQSAGVVLAGVLADHIGTGPMIAVGALGVLAVALNFGRLRSNSTLAQHR
jgi:predicted MFS family arabinose efflux permease